MLIGKKIPIYATKDPQSQSLVKSVRKNFAQAPCFGHVNRYIFSSASGSKIVPIRQINLDLHFGNLQLNIKSKHVKH